MAESRSSKANHQRDEVLATWLTISSRNSACWVWMFSLPRCKKGATSSGASSPADVRPPDSSRQPGGPSSVRHTTSERTVQGCFSSSPPAAPRERYEKPPSAAITRTVSRFQTGIPAPGRLRRRHDAPLIGEHAATRGRLATELTISGKLRKGAIGSRLPTSRADRMAGTSTRLAATRRTEECTPKPTARTGYWRDGILCS
jgi:hypothetical protein